MKRYQRREGISHVYIKNEKSPLSFLVSFPL